MTIAISGLGVGHKKGGHLGRLWVVVLPPLGESMHQALGPAALIASLTANFSILSANSAASLLAAAS